MIAKRNEDYTPRAKSGWAILETNQTGWDVGYLEKKGKTYHFANCIQSSDLNNPKFVNARLKITDKIFKAFALIP